MKNELSTSGEIIRALEFANQNPEGFTREQLAKHLGKDPKELGNLLKYHLGDPISLILGDRLFAVDKLMNPNEQNLLVLSPDGTKMLFEIVEIREIKKQAKLATVVAALSLGISLLAAIPEVVDLLFPATIKFEEKQFQQIEEIMKSPSS